VSTAEATRALSSDFRSHAETDAWRQAAGTSTTMISALAGAGVEGGYLANPRLAKVHWQAGERPLPPPRVSVAGESGLWVDPAEIPSAHDVERLGKALAAGRHGERDQLMANTAAYSGLRWGEIAALTVPQVDTAAASAPCTAR
jgi:integrase